MGKWMASYHVHPQDLLSPCGPGGGIQTPSPPTQTPGWQELGFPQWPWGKWVGGLGDRAVQREGDRAGLLSPLPSTFVLSSFPIPRQALPSESRGLGRGEGEPGPGRGVWKGKGGNS